MVALPQKALFWPAEKTLLVADIHLGKEASLQFGGIPAPMGPTIDTLADLTAVIALSGARRLVFLGDLWHDRNSRSLSLLESFLDWRRSLAGVEMILIEGNHDRKAGELPATSNIQTLFEPHTVGPFALAHYPGEVAGRYVLSGHLHPAVVLVGKARQAMKLPCFWFGESCGVLPAFGIFTGCSRVSPNPIDQVLVIADGLVHPVAYHCQTV